ncbi:MAG TPA: phosphoribosylglycinamide formyltransferase [Bacteroidales bacterium]|jgi:phosphoribosylglycinamide formyltransferase-1|nr:phosphoribosylglycinamide formyltransferase [Bacteroidales bacterium]HRS18627.1 phosphoribosylglycinamide formyltransferase [Bacteroidales bacterium]
MPKIAIFASGSGTNTRRIIEYFTHSDIEISRIYTNNAQAGVVEIAHNSNIPVCIFNKSELYESTIVLNQLQNDNISCIVLAGFLLLMPANIIQAFEKRIINIHPALLPKYGGKGMYGMHVHRAVVTNKETKTGITIHVVDEIYDNGTILFQAECTVLPHDTPETIAQKVHELEYEHFPRVIQEYVVLLHK